MGFGFGFGGNELKLEIIQQRVTLIVIQCSTPLK